jgi:hypothetical protein
MPQQVTHYLTDDGTKFDDYTDAIVHEHLCKIEQAAIDLHFTAGSNKSPKNIQNRFSS